MIDAEMYGMIPSAKIVVLPIAPPEKPVTQQEQDRRDDLLPRVLDAEKVEERLLH
jgi:hypothetical protein